MIEAKNLTMCYGATVALDDVSFSVKENEIVGLLGPNGAGKSTLMRILTTFIYPTKGTAVVCGAEVTQNPFAVRKLIGYLPENPPLYMDMRVDEFVDFVGRARDLRGAELKKRKEWVIEACGISGVLASLIAELSLGYRQRVGLAQALIHDPRVIILDEPTFGLDPMQIVGIRKLIKDLSSCKTIIFSTHILQEAASISDRLLIIDRGKIISQGTIPELRKNKPAANPLIVSIKAGRPEIEAALQAIPALSAVNFIQESAHVCTFSCVASVEEDAARAINTLVKQKDWFLRELAFKEPSLEEIFLGLFTRKE